MSQRPDSILASLLRRRAPPLSPPWHPTPKPRIILRSSFMESITAIICGKLRRVELGLEANLNDAHSEGVTQLDRADVCAASDEHIEPTALHFDLQQPDEHRTMEDHHAEATHIALWDRLPAEIKMDIIDTLEEGHKQQCSEGHKEDHPLIALIE